MSVHQQFMVLLQLGDFGVQDLQFGDLLVAAQGLFPQLRELTIHFPLVGLRHREAGSSNLEEPRREHRLALFVRYHPDVFLAVHEVPLGFANPIVESDDFRMLRPENGEFVLKLRLVVHHACSSRETVWASEYPRPLADLMNSVASDSLSLRRNRLHVVAIADRMLEGRFHRTGIGHLALGRDQVFIHLDDRLVENVDDLLYPS